MQDINCKLDRCGNTLIGKLRKKRILRRVAKIDKKLAELEDAGCLVRSCDTCPLRALSFSMSYCPRTELCDERLKLVGYTWQHPELLKKVSS